MMTEHTYKNKIRKIFIIWLYIIIQIVLGYIVCRYVEFDGELFECLAILMTLGMFIISGAILKLYVIKNPIQSYWKSIQMVIAFDFIYFVFLLQNFGIDQDIDFAYVSLLPVYIPDAIYLLVLFIVAFCDILKTGNE